MEYRAAVHHAALVLDLASKSKKYMRELFEPPDVRKMSTFAAAIDKQHGAVQLTYTFAAGGLLRAVLYHKNTAQYRTDVWPVGKGYTRAVGFFGTEPGHEGA